MFVVHTDSSIHHHHPALLHRHTLILDRSVTFLVVFFIVILKLSFSQSLSFHSRLSFLWADVPELWSLVVWQSLPAVVSPIGKWGRLSQPYWLLVRTIFTYFYLLTEDPISTSSVLTARRSYSSAVLEVVILSVCPSVRSSVCLSHACFVTKSINALRIFWHHTKGQSLFSTPTFKVNVGPPF